MRTIVIDETTVSLIRWLLCQFLRYVTLFTSLALKKRAKSKNSLICNLWQSTHAWAYVQKRALWLKVGLRYFPCFAVRSSSAHEGKIIIFERFHCPFTKITQLNWQFNIRSIFKSKLLQNSPQAPLRKWEEMFIILAILNCTDNYDVAKIKVKSATDHQ